MFVLVEESKKLQDVIGNSQLPFLNNLASQYGLATNYHADVHNSLANYFMLTTGRTIAVNNRYDDRVTENNVVRALGAAGKTWRVYAEGLPASGYLGGSVFPYAKHHNPFAYLSEVLGNSAQASNIADQNQLTADIASGRLADYSFIIPNQIHNGHDCRAAMEKCPDTDKLERMDQWLERTLAPLLASPVFRQNSVLIVTFDESAWDDLERGGGKVATIFVGPRVKRGYRSTTLYQHESTLRFTLEALGVEDLPGAAATAPRMDEFFK